MPFDDSTIKLEVVVNYDGEYSIWPIHLPVPEGWATIGINGSKGVCLAYIAHAWTDMRPVSVRRQKDRHEGA